MKRLILCVFSLLFIAVFAMGAVGCKATMFQQGRDSLLQLSQEDVANAEAMKEMARNHLAAWPVNSGFIKAALGAKIKEIPASAAEAMKELDGLAAKQEWTDEELGRTLGLRVHLLITTVRESLELFAPEVLSRLPALLL